MPFDLNVDVWLHRGCGAVSSLLPPHTVHSYFVRLHWPALVSHFPRHSKNYSAKHSTAITSSNKIFLFSVSFPVTMENTTIFGAIFGLMALMLVFFLYINRKWCFNSTPGFPCCDESSLPSKYVHKMGKFTYIRIHFFLLALPLATQRIISPENGRNINIKLLIIRGKARTKGACPRDVFGVCVISALNAFFRRSLNRKWIPM